jgi:ribonucleoside-diphosphate reductase alpha chain
LFYHNIMHLNKEFRNKFSEDIWNYKYNQGRFESFRHLSNTLCFEVCQDLMSYGNICHLVDAMAEMKWLPGGRYIYYAGRTKKFYNNCFLYRSQEDTREDWSNTFRKISAALMTGGGIGNDYSVYRPSQSLIASTGGTASGPIPAMNVVNDLGRQVMQGGSRRSAMYASLNWKHGDVEKFLLSKDWHNIPVKGTNKTLWDLKVSDFNFPAPLDMTNISVNYDTNWLKQITTEGIDPVFLKNVEQALRTGEPGMSFNFFQNEYETLRNACCELTSEDDSDVCNLASMNFSRINSLQELEELTRLVIQFQICATIRAELPHQEVYKTREKNRRLGNGIMGLHEWLLTRGHKYEMNPELQTWLGVWKHSCETEAVRFANKIGVSTPKKTRAIAPTGSIAILAGTTGGIEPLYAVAYKRRYLKEGTKWHYQYVVDSVAEELIHNHGVDPEKIETSLDLAKDPERRIKFQADVQDFVDHAISSTINLPTWGSAHNNEDKVESFAKTLAKYAPRLRGFTCYPDGARGGQPLTTVPYKEAKSLLGSEFEEHIQTNDVCEIGGKGGSCGS